MSRPNPIATIISLNYAGMRGAFKRSRAQIAAFVIGIALALLTIVGLSVGISTLGGAVEPGSSLTQIITADGGVGAGLVRAIFVIVGFVAGFMWIIIPLLYSGQGSSVDPQRFVLFPIKDRTLQGGVFLAGLLGVPALAALIICLFSASGYRNVGGAAVGMELLAGVLAVVSFVSVSQALVALGSLYIRSTRGKAIFYVIFFIVFFAIIEIPAQLPAYFASHINSNQMSVGQLLGTIGTVVTILSWVPWSAPFELPTDIATGDYASFAIRLAIILVVIVICFIISAWCMKRARLAANESVGSHAKGLGWLGRVPDSPSGAVSGRVAIYWTRDPRLLMGLFIPLILAVLFFFESSSNAVMSPLAYLVPVIVCWFFPMYEANNLSYDGTAFTMHILAGLRGKDDRLGRARVVAVIGVVYLVLVYIVSIFIAKYFDSPNGLSISIAVLGGGLAMLFCGIGLGEVTSTVMMYPVQSVKTPMKNPQGRSLIQVLYSISAILFPAIACLPTIIVLFVLLFIGNIGLLWLVGLVGLVNGIGVLIAGINIGGSILDKRGNKVLHRLEEFTTIQ